MGKIYFFSPFRGHPMKKLCALLILFTITSINCMQKNCCMKNSPPRTHLIPLPEEFSTLESFMDSPPRVSRSSNDSHKKITYLNDEEKLVEIEKVFYLTNSQTTISVKNNKEFAVILSAPNTPFAAAQFMQWVLAKNPMRVKFIGHGFDKNAGTSDDSISFIFKSESKGNEELLFTKPSFTDDELDSVNVEIIVE